MNRLLIPAWAIGILLIQSTCAMATTDKWERGVPYGISYTHVVYAANHRYFTNGEKYIWHKASSRSEAINLARKWHAQGFNLVGVVSKEAKSWSTSQIEQSVLRNIKKKFPKFPDGVPSTGGCPSFPDGIPSTGGRPSTGGQDAELETIKNRATKLMASLDRAKKQRIRAMSDFEQMKSQFDTRIANVKGQLKRLDQAIKQKERELARMGPDHLLDDVDADRKEKLRGQINKAKQQLLEQYELPNFGNSTVFAMILGLFLIVLSCAFCKKENELRHDDHLSDSSKTRI